MSHNKTVYVVDWEMFRTYIRMNQQVNGYVLRTISEQTGIHIIALDQFMKGECNLTANALASLIAWVRPLSVPRWIIKRSLGE